MDEAAEQTGSELIWKIPPAICTRLMASRGIATSSNVTGLSSSIQDCPETVKRSFLFVTDTLKRDPKDMKYIIITHYHADHAGNVAELRRGYRV